MKKYGKGRERKTELSVNEQGELIAFDKIVASKVVVASETLYINRKDGFAGYSLKKDEAIEKCSDLDDVIVIGKDGVMKVMKIADKMFVGKNPMRVSIFRRDDPKVYNIVYRDGQSGRLYAKKFKIGGVTRDKEYPLFKSHSKNRIFYFSVHDSENKNSRVLVHIDPDLKRVREKIIEFDFSWIELQGRSVKGSTLTAHKVDRVVNAPKADGDEGKKNAIDANSKTISEKENLRKSVDKQTEVIKDAKAEKKDSKLISESRKPTKDQGTFDFQDN
jgi:topoisomerase-4 subunit A